MLVPVMGVQYQSVAPGAEARVRVYIRGRTPVEGP
jgi:hypothetical protein